MDDLNTRILVLAELHRIPMIEGLVALDAQASARARIGKRARQGSTTRNRAEEARAESERLGRIIYFLRFRTPPSSFTDEDAHLCEILATNLQKKGEWTGDYSI
jgi:hypothetical protein